MKEITVTIKRETQVKVTFDESVIDKNTLDGIQLYFDEDIFNMDSTPCNNDDEIIGTYSEEEIGQLNYAKYVALQQIGIENEFINLEKGHTNAVVQADNFEYEFINDW